MKRKLHKWIETNDNNRFHPRDKAKYNIRGSYWGRMKCKKCGLEKCTWQHRPRNWETIYFTTDDEGYIIEGTYKVGTLPYSCGASPETFLIKDEDLKIDLFDDEDFNIDL
jgi:hypothetical protein